MSSIPLPALDVRPPQAPPSPLEQYGQLMQLKNQQAMQPLQQQAAQQNVQSGALDLQKQQIALKDQQALNATMQQWSQPKASSPSSGGQSSSSSMPSYDDLVPLAIKNGASFQAVQGIQQHVLQMKAQAATIAMDDARAGSSNAEALKTKNGMIVDAMGGVLNQPDAQLPQAIQQTAQQLAQQGLFDPQHVQQAQQLAQLAQTNPAQARQQLQVQASSMGGFAKLLDNAQKQVQVQQEQGKSDPNSPFYAPSEAAIAMGTAQGSAAINAGRATQAGALARAEAPIRIATAQAEGAARANVEARIARGSDAALATVPPHLVGPATTAATKAGMDYAQAQSVSQSIAEMMDAAKKGNVVSYQLIPQEGALQITTSQGVHRINMAEIQNYGGGSLFQNLEGHLGKALTGQSIPASVLNDMQQMQDVMQRGSQAKYQNDLATINQTYGAKFQPVQMQSTAPQSAPNAGSPPPGATHIVPGSDGKNHYTDGKKDLGIAP